MKNNKDMYVYTAKIQKSYCDYDCEFCDTIILKKNYYIRAVTTLQRPIIRICKNCAINHKNNKIKNACEAFDDYEIIMT